MATRRMFLQGAATLAAATSTPALAANRSSPINSANILALVDTRSRVGASFARSARALGARTTVLDLDPYRAWSAEVIQGLQRPDAIIGFSSLGALFCLERLGWDQGLRVRARIEHLPLANGGWAHHSHAPLPDWGHDLLARSSADFGPAAAQMALECCDGQTDCTHAAPARHNPEHGEPLVTWLLAPRARKA